MYKKISAIICLSLSSLYGMERDSNINSPQQQTLIHSQLQTIIAGISQINQKLSTIEARLDKLEENVDRIQILVEAADHRAWDADSKCYDEIRSRRGCYKKSW